MEKEFPTENFDQDAYSISVGFQPESFWFCYQNFLIHYDFEIKKRPRQVELTAWNPHQLVFNNRIGLISKNYDQLYTLNFEPNQKNADFIKAKAEMEREQRNPKPPNPKKIEAAKAAEQDKRNSATLYSLY